MPLYKWLGNQVLTRFENAALGMSLTEFHSGYRVYSVKALAQIPFEANSDEFHFDTQIIIQLKAGGFRIKEVPIPTYYGDEISYVNGFKYAKDVVKSVIEFRSHEAGLEHRDEYAHSPLAKYAEKHSPFSSHHRLIRRCAPARAARRRLRRRLHRARASPSAAASSSVSTGATIRRRVPLARVSTSPISTAAGGRRRRRISAAASTTCSSATCSSTCATHRSWRAAPPGSRPAAA